MKFLNIQLFLLCKILNKFIKMSSEENYKGKLNRLNQEIEQERQVFSKSESKVIASSQKAYSNPPPEPQPEPKYQTPQKPEPKLNPNPQQQLTNATNPTQNTGQKHEPGVFILDDPAQQNEQPDNKKNDIPQQINNKKEEINEINPEVNINRKSKEELEAQKKQRQKQFEQFLTSAHKLRSILEQKAKFIQIQYEKQKLYWENERNKYEKSIESLNQRINQKDEKIGELMQKIGHLKHQLRLSLEKCEEQSKTIARLNNQLGGLKQQNIEIKLQNKNLKADNKVVIGHLDKLLKQKNKNSEKTARQIFQQRQKRVIDSLYTKSYHASKPDPKYEIYPSDRNQLTNKVKLQKTLEQYQNHRQQSNKKIFYLENELKAKQTELQSYKKRNDILEQNLKKVNQLRQFEREQIKKQRQLIQEYEKRFDEMTKYNQNISGELEKYWRIPRFKQKVGQISRAKRFKQEKI